MLSPFAILLLIPLVFGSSLHKHRRATGTRRDDPNVIYGQFDSITTGQYSVLNNLWGEHNADSGSQYSQLLSMSDSTIAWETSWTWIGGSDAQVKSFANVQLDVGINQQLNAISSMPSTWQWSQSNTGTVMADVAYDLFTSWSAGGTSINEIMIWLANINFGPISAEYNADGQAVPIATGVQIAGYTWDLYSGYNGVNQVYSYLLTSGEVTSITSFSGDIFPFITYLIDNEGVSEWQYLTTAQAGTETSTGTATFTTTAYSLSIDLV